MQVQRLACRGFPSTKAVGYGVAGKRDIGNYLIGGDHHALDRIEDVMLRFIRRAGLAVDGMFGIGFGIAGYLLHTTRYYAPLPLQEWSLIELGRLLSRRCDEPVWTNSGANAVAICETLFGTGRYTPDFAYLSFIYGFGGAIVFHGEPVQGGHGNAREFSGMYDTETLNHRPALKFLIDRLNARGLAESSIYELRQSFDPSWPGVSEWLKKVSPAYNRLIDSICTIVDPQAIVLGGELPRDLAATPTGISNALRTWPALGDFARVRYSVAFGAPTIMWSSPILRALGMGSENGRLPKASRLS